MILKDPDVSLGLRLPLTGHYPALRSALEAGAEAIWLLAPDSPDERITRTLRVRWEDVVQDNLAILALTGPAPQDAKVDIAHKNKARRENFKRVRAKKAMLRDLADATDVHEDEMLLGLPGYGPIVEEAASSTGVDPNHQVGVWRLISGLTHPSASRSLSMSIVQELAEDSDGTIKAELTASSSLTNSALDAALLLYQHALRLASARGGNAEMTFVPPPNLPLPPGYEELLAPIRVNAS